MDPLAVRSYHGFLHVRHQTRPIHPKPIYHRDAVSESARHRIVGDARHNGRLNVDLGWTGKSGCWSGGFFAAVSFLAVVLKVLVCWRSRMRGSGV